MSEELHRRSKWYNDAGELDPTPEAVAQWEAAWEPAASEEIVRRKEVMRLHRNKLSRERYARRKGRLT